MSAAVIVRHELPDALVAISDECAAEAARLTAAANLVQVVDLPTLEESERLFRDIDACAKSIGKALLGATRPLDDLKRQMRDAAKGATQPLLACREALRQQAADLRRRLESERFLADACPEGLAWLGDRTAEEAWRVCHRSDWMRWILRFLCAGVPEDRLRAYAAYVAELTPIGDGRTTWDLLTDERSRQAVRVASWHAVGLATNAELTAAWVGARNADRDARDADSAAMDAARDAKDAIAADSAARDAWAAAIVDASDAWDAEGHARDAAIDAASSSWDSERAAWAAWDANIDAASSAALAVAWAASEAASEAALAAARAWQADALRLHIPDITPYIRKGK